MQFQIQNARTLSDGNRSGEIVASHHPHIDAGLVAALNGRGHLGTQRILDTNDAQQGQACLASERRAAISVLDDRINLVRVQLINILVRETDCAHGHVRELGNHSVCDGLGLLLVYSHNLAGLVHVGDARQDDLARTLRVDPVAATWLRNRPRHHLPRRREHFRDPVVHGGGGTTGGGLAHVSIFVAQLLCHLQERTLRRVSLELGDGILVGEARFVHSTHAHQVAEQ
mmetsp:Transcript_31827/g.82347  ORF Transcript_31827/g.82347 Transcript_31827/m.82347 type:complete len:228 (+) Transcript_31827:1-684(+)